MLSNVVQETPDKIPQEKNPVQCSRNTTGQHCTCKNPMLVAQAQLRLHTTLHRTKPSAMLSEVFKNRLFCSILSIQVLSYLGGLHDTCTGNQNIYLVLTKKISLSQNLM